MIYLVTVMGLSPIYIWGGTTLYWISPANMVMDMESLGVIRSNRNTVTTPMTYICLMHQPAWWTCHDQLVFTPQTTSLGWPIPIHWIQPWLSHDLWWSSWMGSYGWYIFAQPSKYCLCQFGRVFIIINLLGGFHGGKPQLINYKVRPPNNKFVYKFINPLTDHGYNPHQPLALGLICTNLANKSIWKSHFFVKSRHGFP